MSGVGNSKIVLCCRKQLVVLCLARNQIVLIAPIRRDDVFSRDYWKLWAASTGSNLGDGVVLAALPLLAAQLSRDPVAVAGVTVAAQLPWLLFGLFAGVVIDRTDRRRLMWVVDAVRGVVLLGVAVLIAQDAMTLPVVYTAVLILGIGETLFDTASQAVLPRLVEPDQLEVANGRLFGAQLTANGFAGPPTGGALFALAAVVPFIVDSITFFGSALLLVFLRTELRPKPRAEARTIRSDIAEGLRWLLGHRTIRAFAVGAAVINLAFAAATSLLVLLAQDVLGLGNVGYGWLLASAAVGGVAGTLLAGRVVTRIGRTTSVFASVAVLATSLAGMGLSANAWTIGALFAAHAFGAEIWNIVAVSYRQAAVPDDLLGRVMSGYRVIAYGAFPLGAAAGGALARATSLQTPYLAGGILVVCLLAYLVPVMLEGDLDHPPSQAHVDLV